MYFFLSKTVGFFSIPSNLIACLALLGLVLMSLRRPLGKVVAVVALAALAIAALSPLGNILLTPLEQRFPFMRFPNQRIDGVIVLGGSFDTHAGYVNTIILGEDTEPMAIVASLARHYPDAKIIFSGGSPESNVPTEAAIAKLLFISFGIDANRLLIEDQSRNTEENAQFTARMINPTPDARWLLVTNAFHMPRAVGTFRSAGFNVIGFPVGWRTLGWRDFFWPANTATENLRRVDVAVREWVGLTVYRLLRYSNEWFPRDETVEISDPVNK